MTDSRSGGNEPVIHTDFVDTDIDQVYVCMNEENNQQQIWFDLDAQKEGSYFVTLKELQEITKNAEIEFMNMLLTGDKDG